MTPINQLASVSVPDPKTLMIQPWDASQMNAIEKAIPKSDLGLTPANDGKVIRLTMPTLTEERRKQLAKTVQQVRRGRARGDPQRAARGQRQAEGPRQGQEGVRRTRSGGATTQIQKTTDKFMARIDELAKKKEQEVLAL